MPNFQFPASELDRPGRALSLLGGFWAHVYADGGTVRAVSAARADLHRRAFGMLDETYACISRLTVPVFRVEPWFRWILRRSEQGQRQRRYGHGGLFGEAGLYGDKAGEKWVWPAPPGLVACPCVSSRLDSNGLVWVHGIDYTLEEDVLIFRADPLAAGFAVADDGQDAEAAVWFYRPSFDRQTVYRQHGYAVGAALASSERAKDVTNAIYDAIIEGTTPRAVEELVAAAVDAPLAISDGEVVERIFADSYALWVVTDQQAYRCGPNAAAVVAVGDTLSAGQAVCDAFDFSTFRRGISPAALAALAVGRGLLAEGYLADLVFRDEEVPLIVEFDAEGYTKVSFKVHGLAVDAAKFWADVHAKGRQAGQTLANLLDARPNPVGQPTAMALPKTINPLGFLIANVLQCNAGLVRLRPGSYGPFAEPSALRFLRKVVPPHNVLIVLTELRVNEAPIRMEAAGTEVHPGYDEDVNVFLGVRVTETVAVGLVTERVTVTERGESCA